MREEGAIVEIIPITKAGELKRFQVKVPMNAKAVIGVQTGFRLKQSLVPTFASFSHAPDTGVGVSPILLVAFGVPAPPASNPVVGELKLQSSEKPNIFYGTLVRDLSVNEDFTNIPTILGFLDTSPTHGPKKDMEKISIDANTTVIRGIYKDSYAAALGRDILYDVYLAVWFKFETEKK